MMTAPAGVWIACWRCGGNGRRVRAGILADCDDCLGTGQITHRKLMEQVPLIGPLSEDEYPDALDAALKGLKEQ